MNVVIGGNFWFPRGTASAARIRNLAFGLRDCGARVHVIAMAPHPRDGGQAAGEIEGVTYEHAAPTRAAVVGWRDAEKSVPRLREGLVDKLAWYAGLYGAAPVARRLLARRIDAGSCDLFLAYDRSAVRMAPLARLCRRRGVPAVLDVVEVSEHLAARRLSAVYWDSRAGTRSTPRLFTGITVITAGLAAAYASPGYPPTLVVPALAEWPRREPPPPTGREAFHFTYVGALQARDAPELLLAAMRRLAERGAAVRLDVVGHYEGTARGRAFAARCAQDAVLRPVVSFLGTLSDAALERQLAASDGLVLTRRDALPEVMSFPTRLVEYLAHARPVFVSDVGDVGHYLRDGEDAVLLHPRDPHLMAAAMEAVVRSPDRGAAIGRGGRAKGAAAFDRRTHAGRLLEFVAALRREKAA
jgi:glycosyltransferase involved in cell wall biosynthesis